MTDAELNKTETMNNEDTAPKQPKLPDHPKPETPPHKRRLGRFRIHSQLIMNHWQDVVEAMKGMVVVEAGMKYYDGCVHYTALSEAFEPVDVNVEPPEYVPMFNQTIEGVSVEWKMQK